MKNNFHLLVRKSLSALILLGLLVLIASWVGSSPVAMAQAGDPTATPASLPVSDYFSSSTLTLGDGEQL